MGCCAGCLDPCRPLHDSSTTPAGQPSLLIHLVPGMISLLFVEGRTISCWNLCHSMSPPGCSPTRLVRARQTRHLHLAWTLLLCSAVAAAGGRPTLMTTSCMLRGRALCRLCGECRGLVCVGSTPHSNALGVAGRLRPGPHWQRAAPPGACTHLYLSISAAVPCRGAGRHFSQGLRARERGGGMNPTSLVECAAACWGWCAKAAAALLFPASASSPRTSRGRRSACGRRGCY